MSYLPSLKNTKRLPNPRPWLPAVLSAVFGSLFLALFVFLGWFILGAAVLISTMDDAESSLVEQNKAHERVLDDTKAQTPEERLEEALRTNEQHTIPPLNKKEK